MTRSLPRIQRRLERARGPAVPISGEEARPLTAGYQFNTIMGKYEAVIVIGNFPTEAEAQQYVEAMLQHGVFQNAQAVS